MAAKPLCQAVHVYNSVHLPSRRRSQELATRQPIHLMRHGYNAGGGSDVWQLYDAHAIVFRSSRGCGVTLRVRVASAARRYWTSRALHSVIIGWVWLRCMLPFDCMSIFLYYSGSALCSSTTSAARMVHCIRSTLGAACIGIGPLRHRVAALVAVARRHEFLDPLSHVCRAGSAGAGFTASDRPWARPVLALDP